MNDTLSLLRAYRKDLTKQQIKTLKGQVLAWDETGALKGLVTIISRKRKGDDKIAEKTDGNAKRATAL